ncbi:unnamed protein product [Caenorhabditis angaria]|uniref:F-box associated domain-containing protein n=1 Tax=Caenorhabditis angaria TaxID=860376 RepID=A0A9P1MTY9_9PELO|nr:unnamed protein product [Caenorhabditis angaria]
MPRTTRKRKIVSNESWRSQDDSSIGWFDIPLEMREMVTNKMDIKTRCKFMQCSKKCEDEVKISKQFRTGIKISRSKHPEIRIGLGKRCDYHYCLEFIEVLDITEPQVIVVYKTVAQVSVKKENDGSEKTNIKWVKTENGKVEEVRFKYLDEFIKKHWKTIDRFEIRDGFYYKKGFMKQLKNLKSFANHYRIDVRSQGLMDLSQISQIDKCYLGDTKFKFKEVLQFEGSFYQISSDDFDKEHIEKYLKMWKNGELHRNLKCLGVSFRRLYRNHGDCRNLAKSVDGFDYFQNIHNCTFRFLLNYERESKYYCNVQLSSFRFNVYISSFRYDEVIRNRQPLIY